LILKQSFKIVKRLITSDQIRAARALLKWSAEDLAKVAGVGIATIRRFELDKGVPSGQVRILGSLKTSLEAGGVEFVGTPEDRPGVRLAKT
jgi:transcriptional regulator with XRE-family HTH domain